MTEQMKWNDGAISIAVADADVNTRASFITRTYTHLLGAIVAFVALEFALYNSGIMEGLTKTLSGSKFGMLGLFGAFIVGGWVFSGMASRAKTMPMQYLALGAYVVLWALMFCPILYIAAEYYPGVIQNAAILTLIGFSGLTAIAFYTRKDFSFLRGVLMWGGMAAMGLILAGFFMGFDLGLWFSGAMIAYAGAAILYDTSNVLHHYPADRYVAAALSLFASIALLFWYVLRLLMQLQSD